MTTKNRWAGTALGLLLAAGILTLWAPAFAAQGVIQSGLLALAAVVILVRALRGPPPVFHPMVLPLAAAALWGALQALSGLSVSPWRTSNSARDWLVAAATAWLVLQAFHHPEDGRRARTAVALFATAVAAEALAQVFTSDGRVFWLFDSGYRDNVLGPFVYRNKFAQFVELAYPIVVWRALTDRRRAPFWVVAAALLFASVATGASRAGFLLLGLETILVPLLAGRSGAVEKRRAGLLAGSLALAVALWGVIDGWNELGRRLFAAEALQDYRWPIVASTVDMIRARPWLGWGLGTWSTVYPEFARFDIGLVVNQAHNDWMQWWAEGGVVMLFLMLWWGLTLLRAGLRTVWGIGVPVVLLHGLVDYPMQQLPVFACLVAAVGALAGAEAGAFRWGAEKRYKTAPAGTLFVMSRSTILVLLLCAIPAAAQVRSPAIGGPMGDAGAANLPGQRIGPNDLIAISVYDAPEFTRTVRVAADGTLRLPMVTARLKVAGLQPPELESLVAETLVQEGLFIKPVVMVTVAEYASRPIAVVGAVKRPLTFQAVGRVTLLDALARAEGLASEAGPEVLVSLPDRTEEGKRLLRRIAVRDLLEQSRPDLNLELSGGEEIRVPEAKRIFVAGNVKKPGAFPVRDGAEMTVLKALALSEGLSPYPQKLAFIYREDDRTGGRKEIAVELSKIVARKAPDLSLEPGDTLYIPEDRGKRNAMSIVEKAAAFGGATASGVLIWRR